MIRVVNSTPSPLAGEGSERSERVRGCIQNTPHPAAKRRHPLPQGERAKTEVEATR
jgi:hypothetical protein